MKKTKILVVEDNYHYWKIVKEICDQLRIKVFPSHEKEFTNFSSSFQVVLTPPGHYEKAMQNDRIQWVTDTLDIFFGNTPDEEILCICDYQLFEGNPKITGLNFHKKFLGQKDVIIVSATDHTGDLEKINYFCGLQEGHRSFVKKPERPSGDLFALEFDVEEDYQEPEDPFKALLLKRIQTLLR